MEKLIRPRLYGDPGFRKISNSLFVKFLISRLNLNNRNCLDNRFQGLLFKIRANQINPEKAEGLMTKTD